MTATLTEETAPPRIYLTPSERRVLGMFTHDGCDNRTIARRASLSEDTVKTHMRHIFAKANAVRPKDSPALTRTSLAVCLLRRQILVAVCWAPRAHGSEGHSCIPAQAESARPTLPRPRSERSHAG